VLPLHFHPSVPQRRPNAPPRSSASFVVPSRRVVLAALVVGLFAGAALALVLDRLLRFDSQGVASWATVAATIATAGATAALAVYGRVQIAAARRQQRGVATSLRELVRGIRRELELGLTPGEKKMGDLVGQAGVPEIHPWFLPVIPQIAESDPLIIGLFLTLDRGLHNYRASLNRLYGAKGVPIGGDFGEKQKQVRMEGAKTATNDATSLYNECHKTLNDLENALGAVLSGW